MFSERDRISNTEVIQINHFHCPLELDVGRFSASICESEKAIGDRRIWAQFVVGNKKFFQS